jgi:hypothetical protein
MRLGRRALNRVPILGFARKSGVWSGTAVFASAVDILRGVGKVDNLNDKRKPID